MGVVGCGRDHVTWEAGKPCRADQPPCQTSTVCGVYCKYSRNHIMKVKKTVEVNFCIMFYSTQCIPDIVLQQFRLTLFLGLGSHTWPEAYWVVQLWAV